MVQVPPFWPSGDVGVLGGGDAEIAAWNVYAQGCDLLASLVDAAQIGVDGAADEPVGPASFWA